MIKLELSDFYKNMSPVELVRELGHVFATVLAERGHKIDERSPLMNGIVAYEMLSLKGLDESLDKAVDSVMRIIYEGVIEQMEVLKKENKQ